MYSAEVEFSRREGAVLMTLAIDGKVVIESGSQESIVRELQIRGARHLTIDGKFSTELPTVGKTLETASAIDFSELMATLKLIAACSSFGEAAPFIVPKARQQPDTARL